MSSQYDGEESCKLRSATMPDGRTPEPGGWNRIHFDVEDIASEVQRLKGTEVNFRNEIVTVAGMLRHVCVADEAMRGRVSEPEGLVCLELPEQLPAPGGARDILVHGAANIGHGRSALRTGHGPERHQVDKFERSGCRGSCPPFRP